jgi:hypothetical protein
VLEAAVWLLDLPPTGNRAVIGESVLAWAASLRIVAAS